jgi:hypothetical protein
MAILTPFCGAWGIHQFERFFQGYPECAYFFTGAVQFSWKIVQGKAFMPNYPGFLKASMFLVRRGDSFPGRLRFLATCRSIHDDSY